MPVTIRSLADSMAMLHEDQLPIKFDIDFLMMLDTDECANDEKCRIVDQYRSAWWLARKPRDLNMPEILDGASIGQCLDVHKRHFASSDNGYGVQTAVPIVMKVRPAEVLNADVTSSHSTAENASALMNPCRQCVQYRQIISNALNDMLDTYQFSNLMKTSSETQWNMDMRRASAFNLLHETVLIKEMADPSAPSISDYPNPIRAVALNAKRELDRLSSLPPTSYKWTWGEQLTETDVLALRRPLALRPQVGHSGYNISLNPGAIGGRESSFNSLPISHDVQDVVTYQSSAQMQDALSGPSYFKHNHLVYDPLGKIEKAVPMDDINQSDVPAPRPGDKSLITEMEPDIADSWSSGKDDNTPAGNEICCQDVADTWTTDTDEKLSTSVMNENNDIADSWSTDSNDDPPANVPPILRTEHSLDIADRWESNSVENIPIINTLDMLTARRPLPSSNPPASSCVEEWTSEEEEGNTVGIAKSWSTATHDDTDSIADVPWSSASQGNKDSIAESWSSASHTDDSGMSSLPIINSQMAVSPSKITIDPSPTSVLISHDLPRSPTLDAPGTRRALRFAPEHFDTVLKGRSFKYESQKFSDDDDK